MPDKKKKKTGVLTINSIPLQHLHDKASLSAFIPPKFLSIVWNNKGAL